jgi:hypothetical protein
MNMKMFGVLLICVGILLFVYKGITYTTHEKVLDLGPLQVTQENMRIDQKKVESIAASIRTTGFWDNLLVRRSNKTEIKASPNETRLLGIYEIAYGHHRLAALRMLVAQQLLDEYYELELPVRHLDSSAMVRIMAAENPIQRQTVGVVLQYITDETRTPIEEITTEDICQFTGGDWYDHRRTVAGMLKKIRAKVASHDEKF